ncbi:MAG: DEAD/DEAH box helicase family protein [Methylovulum sp.]|uniref:DEAD/DEAH box helicase n=1 Tax=Methylovulum sp. TaxID=1916980 RepID=UPI00260FF7AE|nr:DEAD/DEAH box helicase family protein [Methylovulum sp.]MDD2722900.1 DEAD/DEAH box helicase family protein [Methylovulum sp.]MDD5124857.1 DEAD/DEAH box helicase family protein [Methylovulum sp.]
MTLKALHHVAGRLSLRAPQRESLEALAAAIAATPDMLNPKRDVPMLLETLKAEFPKLSDFEREFPSLCFALATGVGKTRLMGAFVSYLHLAHGINNFFVLAPNLTIYNKLIADFTPNTPKYVFKGISEFAINSPMIITGDDYEVKGRHAGSLFSSVSINIFNISKINSEVRGGKSPRIKRLSEYLGDSYFNYLAQLPDLVLLMDESHRYRADAGVRALNELNPLLGLELTATPFTESGKGTVPFKNVVVDYPLARAMDDGFVKEPAVVTQRNFDASQHTKEEIELIKLQDGIRLHEATKVELLTYAHENDVVVVKPFMLVIARDTTHAAQLLTLMESAAFFAGRYQGKIIQVDSSKSGAAEEEMISRLLAVESHDEPTEVVIHVNMLKEGWDVTNLYTIVPLRAANARTLIEQSIGRGLRLPYGKRTGVTAVDRLNIVAHDRFQEIVDEANNPDNPLRLKQVILDAPSDNEKTESVSVSSNLDGLISGKTDGLVYPALDNSPPVFSNVAETTAAQYAIAEFNKLQHSPKTVATSKALLNADVQKLVVQAVTEQLSMGQQSLLTEEQPIDVADIVAKAAALMVNQTIDIPRVMVVPKGQVSYGYRPFTLNLEGLSLQPSERDIIIQSLQTNEQAFMVAHAVLSEAKPEDTIVHALIDYDDISYDDHADLIYELATQVVRHLNGYLSADEVNNVLANHRHTFAKTIHAQMAEHFWEQADTYEVEVRSGFTPLKTCAYTVAAGQAVNHYRDTIIDKGKIKQLLFGGFSKCLYPVQKFDSDTERRFAVILERDAQKWFKPAKGQFKIYYSAIAPGIALPPASMQSKDGAEHPEYVPDFVAETEGYVVMVETKSQAEMADAKVQAKSDAAIKWCVCASDYLLKNGGKAWKYLLIPHDEVKENFQLGDYVRKFSKL